MSVVQKMMENIRIFTQMMINIRPNYDKYYLGYYKDKYEDLLLLTRFT